MTAETESEDFRWKTPVLSDIMSAKEKQATRSGICFSCTINEQMPDEIGHKALKARICEFLKKKYAKEKQATRSGICLLWKIQKIKGEHNAVTGLGTV